MLLLLGILFCLQSCYVSSQRQESPLCFCAVRDTSLTSGAVVLPFTNVTLNDGDAFDLVSNSFTVPSDSTGGYFWLAWSIGLPPSVYADVKLMGASRLPDIIRRHSLFTSGVDTTSRTELIYVESLTGSLTLSTDYGLFSDAGWQTSFCGFSLFSTMTEVVAFNVGKTTTTTSEGTLVYDTVNVDTHSGYSTTTGQYTIQVDGVYVISFSLASPASTVLNSYNFATLRLRNSVLASVYTLDAGQDMATQTVLIDTAVGDNLSVFLDWPPAYSDIRYQTAFMGFFYTPTRSLPYAWSVATENSYSAGTDPVPFEVVFVRRGSGWNVATYTYTVQSSGVYYIHLTAGMYYSISYISHPVKMELMVNGMAYVNVYRSSTEHYAMEDSRGRAIILRLNESDELRVRVPSDSNYYLASGVHRQTTFSGFRLYDF